jgi:hypothetical protein
VAELNTVLGAILRDVAQSRVTADLFSRNVSIEYQQDPILSGFPVPRVDIVQTTVDLKFAVNSVDRHDVDRNAVIRARLPVFSASLAQEVYSAMIASNPRSAELEEVIKRKNLAVAERLPALIEQSAIANTADVDAAIAGRPDALARKLQATVSPVVLDEPDLREVLTRGTRLGDIRNRVEASAATHVARMAAELRPRGEEIDLASVPRARIVQFAAALGRSVYEDVVLRSPRRPEVERVLVERGLRLDRQLSERAEQALLEDPALLQAALEGEADPLVSKLEKHLSETVLAEAAIRNALTQRTRLSDLRTQLANTVAAALPRFVVEVRAAISAAERQALTIDVAVTGSELAEAPESTVSQISVVSQIRNYQWVDVGASEGISRPRLQPE